MHEADRANVGRRGIAALASLRQSGPAALTHILIAAAFFLTMLLYVCVGQWLAETGAFDKFNAIFGADVPRVIGDLTCVSANHYRTKVHPLFVLLFNPIGSVLAGLLGNVTAAITLTALAGATCVVLFFGLVRRLGAEPIGAALLTGLYALTPAHVMWASVPETWVFGTATLLTVHLLGLAARNGSNKAYHWFPVAGFLSLAMTTTNYVQYLIVLAVSQLDGAANSMRRSIGGVLRRVAVASVLPVVGAMGLAVAQKAIYPSSSLFFHPQNLVGELSWVSVGTQPLGTVLGGVTRGQPDLAAKLVAAVSALVGNSLYLRAFLAGLAYNAVVVASNFLAWGVIAPAPSLRTLFDGTRSVTFVPSSWASYSPSDLLVLLAVWVGAWCGARLLWARDRRVFWQLSGTLVFNLLLHLFYGADESFLYVPHAVFLLLAFLAPVAGQVESGSPRGRRLGCAALSIAVVLIAAKTWTLLHAVRALVQTL